VNRKEKMINREDIKQGRNVKIYSKVFCFLKNMAIFAKIYKIIKV